MFQQIDFVFRERKYDTTTTMTKTITTINQLLML